MQLTRTLGASSAASASVSPSTAPLAMLTEACAAKPWRTATVENSTTDEPSTCFRLGAAAFRASAAPSALTRQSRSKSASVSAPIGFRLIVPTA